MIHTLQHSFKYPDFIAALKANQWSWRTDPEWPESSQLVCGKYIAASVWPQTESTVTWRTGLCGAHNTASNQEEGQRNCEAYLNHCLKENRFATA